MCTALGLFFFWFHILRVFVGLIVEAQSKQALRPDLHHVFQVPQFQCLSSQEAQIIDLPVRRSSRQAHRILR